MEQAYAEWQQAEMHTPRAPSFSSIIMAADTPEVRKVEQFNQGEHAPAQYNQQSQMQTFESSRAPSYSNLANASSQPQVHYPNTSTTSSSIFPLNLPSPNVPIRLEPHSPILDHLTAEYIAQGPHPQIPHVSHAIVDQVHASEILNKHVSDRMPFVRAASTRLQAVLGVRNDLPFDLLMGSGENDARNLVVGADGALVDLGLAGLEEGGDFVGGDSYARGIGENLDAVRGNGVVSGDSGKDQEDMDTQMDFNTDININTNRGQNPNTTAYHRQNINTLPFSPTNHFPPSQNQQNLPTSLLDEFPQDQDPKISHFFLSSSVNPHTGEGLRQYLLRRALLTGSKKRVCRSISFHDFTPDVRTGEFCNKLPDKNGILHPWLSIFIQKPFLTITSPLKNPRTSTPPNFPSPIPTTWLCLAVPLANITTYPIQSDTSLPSSLLEESLLKNKHGLPTKKIARRQDYDFSFQGIPIFEFSTRKLFGPTSPSPSPATFSSPTPQPPISDFLSISSLPPYDPKDPYLPFPPHISQNPTHLQNAARKYAYAAGVPREELHTFGEMMEDESGVDISEELSPNEGIWWSMFYRGITRDRIIWERVRRSMGRGKCRVVVRWEEVSGGEEGVGGDDGRAGLGLGLGLGLERRESEVERVMQEVGRNSKGKTRKGMNGATNQNDGLGIMNSNTGIHTHSTRLVSGSGSGEAIRARTNSNKMSINGPGHSGTDIETQNSGENAGEGYGWEFYEMR
ncbi:27a610fc-df6e-408e-b216-d2051637afc8 [Sclerotinia trifoliorum]|uniref:27a610fc-df6e-408e-b216-d2051637afc8 n=1 Tax=Sclerotinia trifoliorum TaxID=28548 RepID=A0A8H2VQ06_9HELO|nr:27a610fc-df6e-408e-b216-d2051637afc8 [Sclerotinia trifoliorum]